MGYLVNGDGNSTLKLVITTTETQQVFFSVSAPGINFQDSGSIMPSGWKAIEIPHAAEVASINQQNSGIYLTTTSDNVNVFGENTQFVSGKQSIGSFNVLPVTRLNVDQYTYYGISFSADDKDNSTILIVGTELITVMELTVTQQVEVKISSTTITLNPGRPYLFTITQLQTVYIASPNDLTGTKIVTDQPVAVFSGHQCSSLAVGDSCDHIVEQIPPTVLWDTIHYFSPPATSSAHTIKFLAADNSTSVHLHCNAIEEIYIFNEGETFSITLEPTVSCAIHSNKGILVSQLGHYGSSGNYDGHLMMLVPGAIHYSNKFDISTIYDNGSLSFNHYANVIVLAEYYQPDMIYLVTGGQKQLLCRWIVIRANNIIEAYVSQIPIPYGLSSIVHDNTSAQMGVMVYGYSGSTGYGHYGGLNLEKFLRMLSYILHTILCIY